MRRRRRAVKTSESAPRTRGLRTEDGALTRKGPVVVGAAFLGLTLVVLALLMAAVSHRELHETY